jgi:hypothetical protein
MKILHPIVPFHKEKDKLLLLDLTAQNTDLTAETVADTALFSTYISKTLHSANARYGIGGYDECI